MPSFTIKHIPDRLHKAIKERAARNRRSVNNEILVRLERSLESFPPGRTPAEVDRQLAEIRRFRKTLKYIHLTDEFLDEAKNEGRM